MVRMIPPGPDLAAKLRGRVNKIRGDHAEQLVLYRLRQMGFLAIVKLETGWRVKRARGRIIGATPLAKVTGDFRAVGGMGQSVLVETKRRDGKLRLCDFAPHSRQALTDHADAGGASLIAWVSTRGEVVVFPWGRLVERGRKALTWHEVAGHDLVAWAKARDPNSQTAKIVEALHTANHLLDKVKWITPEKP